jgi:DNA-nicking Smr family endonuclease
MENDTQDAVDDADLFRRSVGKVKRLRQDRVIVHRSPPAPVPVQRLKDEREVLQEMASGLYDEAEIETGEELLFVRTGVQHGLLRKLRRGQLSVEAELDLHGMNVPAARESLYGFLSRAQTTGLRCVRVIHGKGLSSRGRQPVLKGKVNLWLRQLDAVLAFCSTRPVHGGTGAVYILLKRG